MAKLPVLTDAPTVAAIKTVTHAATVKGLNLTAANEPRLDAGYHETAGLDYQFYNENGQFTHVPGARVRAAGGN